MADEMTPGGNEIAKIHERLDDLFTLVAKADSTIQRIDERCAPCRRLVDSHQIILHGNGKTGMVERLAAAETGRTDTLSVKSTIALVGAIGALAASIGAAMAALVK